MWNNEKQKDWEEMLKINEEKFDLMEEFENFNSSEETNKRMQELLDKEMAIFEKWSIKSGG